MTQLIFAQLILIQIWNMYFFYDLQKRMKQLEEKNPPSDGGK